MASVFKILSFAVGALILCLPSAGLAQGQDGTQAERDLTVIAVMLPGTYDNREQVYFDGRLGVREEARHERVHSKIVRADLPAFGEYVFFVCDNYGTDYDNPHHLRLYVFSADNDAGAVRMRIYFLANGDLEGRYDNAHLDLSLLTDRTPQNTPYAEGCDVFWRREAGQFHGKMAENACRYTGSDRSERIGDYEMMLSENALWIREYAHNLSGNLVFGNPDGVPHKLTRARDFTCYADMPGVSGGRDIPFTRFDNLKITDQGGQARFTSEEDPPRIIEINLRNVDWQMNNEIGAYTRDSLVMYISSRNQDGSPGEFFGYTFTQPDAERLGINLGFILVNCFMVSNREATPEF